MVNTRQKTIMNPEPTDALRDTIATLIRTEIEKMIEEMRNVSSSSTAGQNMARQQSDNQRGLNNMQYLESLRLSFQGLGKKMLGGGCLSMSSFSMWMVLQMTRRQAVLQRFGLAYDDPLAEIKKIKHMFSLEVVVNNDEEDIVWKPTNEDVDCEISDVINDVQEENSVPHISLNALTGINTFQTIRVSGYVGKHEIHILIDSSTNNFLDPNTTKRIGCQLKSTYPFQVTVANGNNMMSSKMCKMKWSLQGEEFVADMMILPLGGCEMVLGIQWLSILGNINCNFRDLKMGFQYNRRTINLRGSQKGVVQWLHGKHLAKNMGVQAQLSFMVLCMYPEPVLSMVSAKPTTNNVPKGLQTLLEDYNDVFVVPKELPPKDAIEIMVQEFLDVGVIRHNQSPFSCPIVMIKKKDGSWRMCVDYRQLNKHTIKDKFPISLIEELIDEPFGSKVLSKLDLRRFIKDYAMISYPLTKLLRKNAFVWNNEAEQAFMQLKEAIMVAPVLKLPNFEKDFVVETDASGEGFDYEIKYKRGKDNAATNALSKIHGNAQLLHMLVFTLSTDVQQRIVEIWTDDVEIQALIAKLKIGKDCAKHYSWSNNLLTRKGKLVVGTERSLQHDLIVYFHSGTIGGHSLVKVTNHSLCALLYLKEMRKHIKQFVNEYSVCQLNKADLAVSPGLLQPFPIPQRVWFEVSMGFINSLPASRGKTVILVVVYVTPLF
nr:hypothetical protein [Tanacetum cinerariifolium]